MHKMAFAEQRTQPVNENENENEREKLKQNIFMTYNNVN